MQFAYLETFPLIFAHLLKSQPWLFEKLTLTFLLSGNLSHAFSELWQNL